MLEGKRQKAKGKSDFGRALRRLYLNNRSRVPYSLLPFAFCLLPFVFIVFTA